MAWKTERAQDLTVDRLKCCGMYSESDSGVRAGGLFFIVSVG